MPLQTERQMENHDRLQDDIIRRDLMSDYHSNSYEAGDHWRLKTMGIKFIACYVKSFGKYAVLVGIQIYNLFEGLDDLAERLCKPLNQLSDVLLGAGLCGRSRRLPSSPRRRGCLWHFHPIETNSGDGAGGRLLELSICWILAPISMCHW